MASLGHELKAKVKVGVLISGRGSNLQALIDAAQDADYPAEIVLVLSNRPNVAGLERAQAAGIATHVIDHRDFGPSSEAARAAFETEITAALESAEVELVCHAGFMRIVTAGYVNHWRDRLINIHPSLLPAFPGLDTHQRALDAGVKLSGCTVHFVRTEVDQGPIIGQAAVPVLPEDSAETLAARVLAAEHQLYPLCLRLVAEGRVTVCSEAATLDLEGLPAILADSGSLLMPSPGG